MSSKNLFIITAAVALAISAATLAGLCPNCKDKAYTKDIGECSQCKGMTTSGQFKLCMKCSADMNQCQHCRKALPATQPATSAAAKLDTSKDGTYKSGPWEYRYSIHNAGTRSQGYFGDLFYDGKAVAAPQQINDHLLTPWGMMYWVGDRPVAFGSHRWMPKRSPSGKGGQLLTDPAGKGQAAVFVQVLRSGANGADEPELAPWIKTALSEAGAKNITIVDKEFLLTPAPVVLHDSRHFGHCEISLGPVAADKGISVSADGEMIELPYRNGATKLAKHTISSSVASMDLYLALRVEISLPAGPIESHAR
ncbi:MAG: hypothetical protein ABFD92_01275 [Planctomycetaceae bacterium]|nr:hypothetical protein [Planctomycetaceae bacterium]